MISAILYTADVSSYPSILATVQNRSDDQTHTYKDLYRRGYEPSGWRPRTSHASCRTKTARHECILHRTKTSVRISCLTKTSSHASCWTKTAQDIIELSICRIRPKQLAIYRDGLTTYTVSAHVTAHVDHQN